MKWQHYMSGLDMVAGNRERILHFQGYQSPHSPVLVRVGIHSAEYSRDDLRTLLRCVLEELGEES